MTRYYFDIRRNGFNENHSKWMAIAAEKNPEIAELEARIESLEQLPSQPLSNTCGETATYTRAR